MSKKRVRLTSEELKNRRNSAVDFNPGKELEDYPRSELMSIVTAFRAFKSHGATELSRHYASYEEVVLKHQDMDLSAFIELVKNLETSDQEPGTRNQNPE
jgi:hypothetical protein